jgi:hypothetical protein
MYFDIVPAYLSVNGKIYGSNSIRNVTITYGNDTEECGKNSGSYFDVSCKFFINTDIDHITITVVDYQGAVISETRNFTSYAGPPPPSTTWISGQVVDTIGNPVNGAVLIFESAESQDNNITVNTTTGFNGRFSMKKAFGFHQKITIQKAGYQILVRDVTFKPYDNELNFTLSSQKQSAPGFAVSITFFSDYYSYLDNFYKNGRWLE